MNLEGLAKIKSIKLVYNRHRSFCHFVSHAHEKSSEAKHTLLHAAKMISLTLIL